MTKRCCVSKNCKECYNEARYARETIILTPTEKFCDHEQRMSMNDAQLSTVNVLKQSSKTMQEWRVQILNDLL